MCCCGVKQSSRRRSLLASLYLPSLFFVFGMSGWLSINTIWIEMPLLASVLPEAWDLPAYVSLTVQVGNIGPLLMLAIPNKENYYAVFIYMIIATLIGAHLALAFAFSITVPIAGQIHSVPLIILAFFLSLCDCTSNVTFFPYMAKFNQRYLIYFLVGSGAGGVVPAILGLVQGSSVYTCVVPNATNGTTNNHETNNAYPVYSPPRFDFPVFMFTAIGLLVLSFCAFITIEIILRHLKRQVIEELKLPSASINRERIAQIKDICGELASIDEKPHPANKVEEIELQPPSPPDGEKTMSPKQFIPDYCLNGFICLLVNGFMPSIQSYSALPYGQLVYSLVVCLSVAAVPLSSWLTMCVRVQDLRLLAGLIAAGAATSAYVLALAFLCPTVPLQQDAGGYFLVIFAWFMTYGLIHYSRACIVQRVRHGGHRPLFWFGFLSQGSSMVGAITAFLLVPIFQVVQDPKLC